LHISIKLHKLQDLVLVHLDTKMEQGQEVHPYTAVTKSWCDLVELSALDLEEILIHSPESLGRVRVVARLNMFEEPKV
jgi:hypothetical protein